MRILVLVSRDWTHPQATGGDAHTCDCARYLANHGHEVTLLAARYPGSTAEQVLEGVRIVRPGRMFFLALRALSYYLRHRREFDIVFEEGMASARLPFLAPLYVRRPLVAIWYQINQSIFSEQYPRLLALVLTWAERLVLVMHRRCLILTPSSDRRQDFLAIGFRQERVCVIPPLMLDSRPSELPNMPRKPVIAWIGKIRRYKCPHHAVEAMPEVISHVPEAKLVIAGRRDSESYETELLNLAERMDVKDHVDLQVDISDAEKWELLTQARALVVTSPVEGFSIVIIEANRCGTPIVATEGVPVDTARDGYNGFRVPFGDRHALAAALVRLLGDHPLFEKLSLNARLVADEFSIAQIGQRLEDTFAAAAAGSGVPAESQILSP